MIRVIRVLLAGTSIYDTNFVALAALQKEWTRANTTYAQRVAHLKGSAGGLNAGFALSSSTIQDDAAADILTGGPDNDAFWGRFSTGARDKITDKAKAETSSNI
ncbi:MAG: hypothetical protein ABSH20_08005 [Tepidisphaeraceae bacterium]